MRISLVVAVSLNRVIGADGDLAWRISDDLKWFKKVTMNKPLIMGRKTFQSIGRPLPGRDNIIVTRAENFAADGAFVARSIEEAIDLAKACAERRQADEICVIGGGEIYAQMLPRADRIYLTRVQAEIAGDTLFPLLDSAQWVEERQFACEKNARNDHACEFFILNRSCGKG